MAHPDLDDLPLDEIMRRWPQTLRLFVDWRLHCVGCPIADFHTLADAAEEHGYALAELRKAVLAAIEGRPIATVPAPDRRQSAAAGGGP